jgi:hypothetical protein
MKRVLRSCFEPLPRFMSMKSLTAVVALLLVGTAISVVEYLESARSTMRRPAPERGACHAAESRSGQEESLTGRCPRAASDTSTSYVTPEKSSASEASSASERSSALGTCARTQPETVTAPPFSFQPSAESIGSPEKADSLGG